jgi:hypothetical protein
MRLTGQTLGKQLRSPEFYALLIIFCLNVLVLQFYLGTARVQLEEIGDHGHAYMRALSFIVPGLLLALLRARSLCVPYMVH